MAEYYAVLKKAAAGLGNNTADARRAVYDKARNALIGQLKAIDPPLPTSEISRQRLELEEAIRKVERESATLAPPPPLARAAAPRQAASAAPARALRARVEPEPEVEEDQDQADAAAESDATTEAGEEGEGGSAQDVFRRAIQEAEARGAAAAMQQNRPPVPMRSESAAMARPEPQARSRERPEPEVRPAVEPPLPPRQREPVRQLEPPAAYGREAREPEPRLAPDYDYEWEPTPPPAAAQPSAYVERDERPAKKGGRKRGYAEDNDRDLAVRETRPSRLPVILLFILIVAMLAGLAALAWSQRAILTDLLTSFESSNTPPKPAAKVAAPLPAASNKNADRLLQGGAAPPADQNAATDKSVRVVDGPKTAPADANAPTAAAAPTDATASPPAPAAANDQTPPADAAAQTAAPAAAATPDKATGDALVAQKAVLYEEPLDAASSAAGVVAINAVVTWSFATPSDGPEIQAKIEVPDRKIKIRLTIRKNADKTLPASHLVEVMIDTPSDFPGKGIRAVPRVVMKPTEEARGQPLIGASAKVADGFFWIALSATDSDVTANLALLKERSWIDLPFVYETGQRAILTFEKGPPGDRVFEKALAAWGNS